jgi:ribosome biogenesis GTPase
VDQLAAVFSVAQPEPVFTLLDRLLVLAESNGIAAFLVVNKVDLSGVAAAREQFRDYERVGYAAVWTSAVAGSDIGALGERLRDRVTLFVGPSGVGKSSLLNALQPGLGLQVGGVSRALERGRHTTVAASLHPLGTGGYVLDTPGLSRLEFWEVERGSLESCFPEFRSYLGGCRFQDCRHAQEPGCLVREAVEAGSVSARRYESYLTILAEREAKQRY